MEGAWFESKEPNVPTRFNRNSWGAVRAGLFVAIAIQIMFAFLGAACGIFTLDLFFNPHSASTGLSMGAILWLLVSWLVSIWAGSFVAAWMSDGSRWADGTAHGVLVWSHGVMVWSLVAAVLLVASGVSRPALGKSHQAPSGTSGSHGTIATLEQQSIALLTATDHNHRVQQSESAPPTGAAAGTQIWRRVLCSFIALILGLAAAAWGGATGTAALARFKNSSSS